MTEAARPALDGEAGSRWAQAANQRLVRHYDPVVLQLGRNVYADLQEARQAVLDKHSTNLRVALLEARDAIHQLQLPPEVIALDAQWRVIRNDLGNDSKKPDRGLWVPVSADIDAALEGAPEWLKSSARQAIRRAQAASGQGDRAMASAQIDVVQSSLQYLAGRFPLHRVKQDLAAAWAAASLPEPDWSAALEAVQSSLGAFHWYTQASAQGLVSAYNATLDAYALATSAQFRPDQRQYVLDRLAQAEHDLRDVPGGAPLADKAHGLIVRVVLEGSDIRPLLEDIQSQIDLQTRRAAARYWTAIGSAVTRAGSGPSVPARAHSLP